MADENMAENRENIEEADNTSDPEAEENADLEGGQSNDFVDDSDQEKTDTDSGVENEEFEEFNVSEGTEEVDSQEEDKDLIQKRIEEMNETVLGGSRVTKLIGTQIYFQNLPRAKTRPVPSGEAEYVRQITKDYDWNINVGETVFLNSGSENFNTQFEKAKKEYAYLKDNEFPIILYDKTVRMNAKYGFVLTNKYLYINMRDFVPYRVRLSQLSKIVVDFGETSNDWSEISLILRGYKRKYPFFKSLDGERVVEIADVLLKMIYHLVPVPRTAFEVNGKLPQNLAEDLREDAADADVASGKIGRKIRQLKRMLKLMKIVLLHKENLYDKPAPVWNPVEPITQTDDETFEEEDLAEEEEPEEKGKGKKSKKGKKKSGGKGDAKKKDKGKEKSEDKKDKEKSKDKKKKDKKKK
jgi:hypothetical protein